MEISQDVVTINGQEYVKKGSSPTMSSDVDGMPFVIVRTYSAGVFAGYLKSRNGQECELVNFRRLWQWAGACSLSQLAVDGTKSPNDCKFAVVAPYIVLTQAIEILKTTESSQKSILGVAEWKK